MGQHHHVVPGLQHLFQRVQQLAELFLNIGVALAVAEIFDAVHLGFAHTPECTGVQPVGGINDQRAAGDTALRTSATSSSSMAQLVGWGRRLTFEPFGAALGVDENRIRKMGCKGGFADASGPYSTVLTGASGCRW